ncbi:MAG: carboxylating nicotinate-nucleotide diphosphorylase [Chloroflexi bacterium]|nr:carboxylating nicotinate-nucleotide diphosphorylase [Chloroflexota bacterium]
MLREEPPPKLPILEASLLRVIDAALEEDLGMGDVTTDSLIDPGWRAEGALVVKAPGVLAGMPVAATVFHRVDPAIAVTILLSDGATVAPGDVAARVAGPAASILKAERVALNLLQRLSGTASETARYVEAVGELPARVLDTRKTTPGLRALEKYAVRVGGGHNHRHNLADGVLIKDNHLEALALAGRSLTDAVRQAKAWAPHTVQVEVEVTALGQAEEAVLAGADCILLDNMPVELMRQAVRLITQRAAERGLPRPLIEASGGITLATVRAVAETGVDLISVGALTHSAKALDISLELSYRVG